MVPRRRVIITPGEIYHIFNRSVGQIPIFIGIRDYKRALEVLGFYIYAKPPLKFSRYNVLPKEQKDAFISNLKTHHPKIVDLFVFCLMSNHLHFLIKEIQQGGISTFMSNFQNSYAKYFNTKSERTGSVFQSMFKAVRIETEEQLLHVCRYIHLNPLTSYLIRDNNELDNYYWSSWIEYNQTNKSGIVNTTLIMAHFPTSESFRKFTFDQAAYQRNLEEIKHLVLE